MRETRVWLALGSNLGDRELHLAQAITHLRSVVTIDQLSSLYETAPVGYEEQPAFLNMVGSGLTQLAPWELLHYAKQTETTLGRQPTFRNGPRLIDIDLLLYDTLILSEENLVLPHPRMHERAFVLVPLAEIAPDVVHPLLNRSIADLVQHVSSAGIEQTNLHLPTL
jgi:2-amino-4-hydroxy-6-hydroxymethyldihydropteridine diphosphokinase